MPTLPPDLLALVGSGPLCHLATISPDGSPHVTVVWVGVDDGDLVTAHMRRQAKLRNLERDPRSVLSFAAAPQAGVFLAPYAVIKARATIEHTEAAWELLNRLAPLYIGPGATFPAARAAGYLVRHTPERIGGVGPWAAAG